jgi:hypothetical protein
VFLTRGILYLFMLLAHGLSCFLSRQMEFDADRYQARLAGSAALEETIRRVMALDLANQAAFGMLAQCWRKERYPDDFPTLIVAHANVLPPKLLRVLDKQMKKATTGLFDSHPCFKERLASARKENAPGIFHLDKPGTVLFRNYQKLAALASLDLYKQMFGKRVKRSSLVAAGKGVDLQLDADRPTWQPADEKRTSVLVYEKRIRKWIR